MEDQRSVLDLIFRIGDGGSRSILRMLKRTECAMRQFHAVFNYWAMGRLGYVARVHLLLVDECLERVFKLCAVGAFGGDKAGSILFSPSSSLRELYQSGPKWQ